MSVFNSLNVSVLIVLLVAGLVVGLSVSGIDLLNPNTSAAEARSVDVESAHRQKMYELEERKAAARTDAELKAIRREQELLDARHEDAIQTIEQKRANRQRWADAAIAVATFIGNAAGITIVLAVLGAVVTTIVKAIASARSVSVEQRPAAQARVMPEIQIVSPLPERQPYEPLDWIPPTGETLQQLHDRRLAERMQEVTQQKEADLFEARMRALSDPARISREQYHRFPNAG